MDELNEIRTSTARKNFLRNPEKWILTEETARVRVYEFHHFGIHLAKLEMLSDYNLTAYGLPGTEPKFEERSQLYEIQETGAFGVSMSYTNAMLKLERSYKTIMNGGREDD